MLTIDFLGGTGYLVGSFLPITYNSIVKQIEVKLSHSKDVGRMVTLAYWICNKDFDIMNLEMNPNKTNGPKFCNAAYAKICQIQKDSNNEYQQLRYYVDTNLIPINGEDTCKFTFNDNTPIKASKIFIALISSMNNPLFKDYTECTLSLPAYFGTMYIKNSKDGNIKVDNTNSIKFGNNIFEQPDGTIDNVTIDSTINKPAKIVCSKLSYRTWSDPKKGFKKPSGFTKGIGYLDGGNDYNEVDDIKNLSFNGEIIKTRIINKLQSNSNYVQNKFIDDYYIPEGRLSDVEFARPDLEAYNFDAVSLDGASSGRWVFKRSRIKFTIPPAKNANGIINKEIEIKYRVVTSIFYNDKSADFSKEKIYQYTLNESKKDINIVICPRDEGILDNMEFTVILSRRYKGANNWSDAAKYKFHTYQKPIVNIAYPKIVRNLATEEYDKTGNLVKSNFKYAKILTSNMYSNFNGEKIEVNKYVCDALNVILATPMNDASDIPMFVRFFVAEYKYGRDGRVQSDGKTIDTNFDTVQSLYKSQDRNKYASKEDILLGDNSKRTAYMTGIYANDGQPILLSGRFTENTLKDVGKQYKLWTYKDWNSVTGDGSDGLSDDELVGNAWKVEAPIHDAAGNIMTDNDGNQIKQTLTKDIVGDHLGAPYEIKYADGTTKDIVQNVSKQILFRAGYIYLLRVRMFHGAAAGAIGAKYSGTDRNDKYSIIYGNSGSGTYDYYDSIYGNTESDLFKQITYPKNDISEYGALKPFNGWSGPDDGTSGIALWNNSKIDNPSLKEIYPGFSEVDYTLIEPVCPFTSKRNLVTVHPTSPQIGANQWLSFNYRHLSKNLGGIDHYSTKFINNKYNTESNVFGKTANGIQNTITRIVSMYTSCVESILNNFNKHVDRSASGYDKTLFGGKHTCTESDPTLEHEKISIWIKPINERQIDNSVTDLQQIDSLYNKNKSNNHALIFEHNIANKSLSAIYNGIPMYTQNSLCYQFNEYRKLLESDINATRNIGDITEFPECEIIYRKLKKPVNTTSKLQEPLGNVYRWQPVINAISTTNNSVSEIQIQNNTDNNNLAKNYTVGENTLRQNRTFKSDDITLKYTENSTDYDLQTKYFYQDVHTVTAGGESFTCDKDKRFCIKEFCGTLSGKDFKFEPGGNVMYTTASIPIGTIYGNTLNKKYFCIALSMSSCGHLYSRVPTTQDCENGMPTPNNLSNIGNISSKGAISVNSDENNCIPITRTTHYLYFKTWINTTFVMKVDIKINYNHDCKTDENGNHTHKTDSEEKTFYFNGSALISDTAIVNEENSTLLDQYPTSEIKFGNANGLSEVYGEDNHGWGRCLSADDVTNRKINSDGTIASIKNESGGLEVPLMVRYTPLLQPKLIAKTCLDSNTGNEKYLSLSSNNVTLKKCNGKKQWNVSFDDNVLGEDNKYKQISTGQIDLKIAYPYINEQGNYNTACPNGGLNNAFFEDYYIDMDTDPTKSIDKFTATDAARNMDFIGGMGICTAYTVLLVPNDPNIPTNNEKQFFNNTDGHWDFYKRIANYYKNGNIFTEVRSKSIPNCGPVLVAYNIQPQYLNSCEAYLSPYIKNNTLLGHMPFVNEYLPNMNRLSLQDKSDIESISCQNCQTIPLKFSLLRQGKILAYNIENEAINYNEVNSINPQLKLTKDNILQPGVIYDLVIIPIYSNRIYDKLDYNRSNGYGPGTINDVAPGGGTNINEVFSNNVGEVHLAGSNPLVLYNYLQIGNEITESCNIDDGTPPTPDIHEPNPQYIFDSDSAIVFPNVDNKLFNIKSGIIKETPGFWLNNSFKLILRMPSFRTKNSQYSDTDVFTIENMSHGLIDDLDDFEFSDIQIHIGKISELTKYGYPNELELNLNKLTSKEDLAKAHIISYSHYKYDDVFSKKLDDSDITDIREKVTAGSLNPSDVAYSHRFIEVNLSNCKISDSSGNMVPIYTDYPEGYYIQFRWKTAYAAGAEEQQWSDWYGGSYDGGLSWWGENGLNYFIPIRNYSDVYTDFRNHIKESYPSSYNSMPKEPIEISSNNKVILDTLVGKGSLMNYGHINNNSLTNPKESTLGKYYHTGTGNRKDSPIVPTNDFINITNETLNEPLYGNIELKVNNDSSYLNEIMYLTQHDNQTSVNTSEFNNHQNLWEMLYIDYIIRNMCKLYYKPKYNSKNENFNNNLYYHLSVPYEKDLNNNNTPIILNKLTWGWDNTEYHMFNKTSLISVYKGLSNEQEFNEDKSIYNKENVKSDENKEQIIGTRRSALDKLSHTDIRLPVSKSDSFTKNKWDINKYYRRMITRQDFDELNSHLKDLVTFIRNPLLTGLNSDNKFYLSEVLPIDDSQLYFDRTRAGIIGHSIHAESGLKLITENNNLNHTMMSSNYIQNIWQNILSVCRPGIRVANPDTKTDY